MIQDNQEKAVIVALFDADGTLYSAQFGRGLLRYAAAHQRRHLVLGYYASLAPALILSRLKVLDRDRFQRAAIARLSWLLGGWDESQVLQAFEWVSHAYLLPTRRLAVIQRLQEHQAQGHRTRRSTRARSGVPRSFFSVETSGGSADAGRHCGEISSRTHVAHRGCELVGGKLSADAPLEFAPPVRRKRPKLLAPCDTRGAAARGPYCM